jgi:GNAT superfamily N-acetyltransferase
LHLEPSSYSGGDAQLLTAEVQAEYQRRYGGPGDESPIDSSEFDAPHGLFVIGYVNSGDRREPAAMGGWRSHGNGDAEIKRMYVRPQFARRGYARAVLDYLEHTARQAGIKRLILETGLKQPEAIALYTSCGYQPVDKFGHYADDELSVHLGKDLVGD